MQNSLVKIAQKRVNLTIYFYISIWLEQFVKLEHSQAKWRKNHVILTSYFYTSIWFEKFVKLQLSQVKSCKNMSIWRVFSHFHKSEFLFALTLDFQDLPPLNMIIAILESSFVKPTNSLGMRNNRFRPSCCHFLSKKSKNWFLFLLRNNGDDLKNRSKSVQTQKFKAERVRPKAERAKRLEIFF